MNCMDLKLHHIGIVVNDIEIASAAYTDKFGYVIKSCIIHDQIQTARVQFLQLNADVSYVELITPDGPESKLTNALKKGGGLNHFCYLTAQIDETCNEMESKGAFVLQQPVVAAAFPGRKIAWIMGRDGIPVELLEGGLDEWELI